MSQTYFAILTAVGEAKLANAIALNVPLQISRMAVGDGGGVLPVPVRTQTALVGEKYRADLNSLIPDPLNASQIIAELVVPESIGGWWMREMAVYDDAGDMIAVSNCPPSYKPVVAEGSGKTQVLRMVLIVSSTAAVQLKIDPSVVLATRAYVDAAKATAIAAAANMIVVHMADDDPHPQYVNSTELAAAIANIDLIPVHYSHGLILSNNVATATTDIDLSAGAARGASAGALRLLANTTKRLQGSGSWSAGSGGNGLLSGTRTANTWYHAYLIRKDSDQTVDVGYSPSLSPVDLPAGYSNPVRLKGRAVKTDASGNIIPFINTGISTYWKSLQQDMLLTNVAPGSQTVTISVPPGIRVKSQHYVSIVAEGGVILVRSPESNAATMVYLGAGTGFGGGIAHNNGAVTGENIAGYCETLSNTSSQVVVQYHAGAGYNVAEAKLFTAAWTEE